MNYTLWGTKIGAEDWQEDVITFTTDPKRIEAAKQWALANGFDRLRVATDSGEKPDFVGTINRKRK